MLELNKFVKVIKAEEVMDSKKTLLVLKFKADLPYGGLSTPCYTKFGGYSLDCFNNGCGYIYVSTLKIQEGDYVYIDIMPHNNLEEWGEFLGNLDNSNEDLILSITKLLSYV